MLVKIVSWIACVLQFFISLFGGYTSVEVPEVQPLIETPPALTEFRINDKICGVSGSEFYIQRPSEKLNVVDASQFGLDSSAYNNFDAFQRALDYCKDNPGTKLNIVTGVYYLRTAKPFDYDGITDLLIDGNGSTFITGFAGTINSITACDCVEIRNLNFDWNWDECRLASVVKVDNENEETNTLDLVFLDTDNIDDNPSLSSITQCDPETFTFGANNSSKEVYFYQNPDHIVSTEKIASNILRVKHNGCMGFFDNGETYILRHFTYNGRIFEIQNYSKNITFDNVKIYGSPGMGYVIGGNSSHFQILNSVIGVNPEFTESRHVSATADGVHIVNTEGCFNISGCDFSGLGDDSVNVHDGLGYINSVDGNKISVTASAMRLVVGDEVSFKDDYFNQVDLCAHIVNIETIGIKHEITLDTDVSSKIFQNCILYSKECDSSNYVIRNNYFHDHRARGLLLQSSNGLCENNTFYKIQGQAIKVIMDIIPHLWQEGTGVDNVQIIKNKFIKCNYSGWGAVIELGSNIDGRKAEAMPFTNIVMKGNTFDDFSGRIIDADNVNNIEISENSILFGNTFKKSQTQGKIRFGNYCANVSIFDNEYNKKSYKKIVQAESVKTWAQINSQL